MKSNSVEAVCRSLATSGRFCRRLAKPLHGLCQFLAVALLVCQPLANAAAAVPFAGRSIVRTPDMCDVDIVDTVTWYAAESVDLAVYPWRCGKPVEIPDGASACWIVADENGTNWLARYADTVETNRVAFSFGAGEGALPDEHEYSGFVTLLSGTNVLGVLDRHDIRVIWQPDSATVPVGPVTNALAELAAQVAALAAEVAEMELATNAAAIAECVSQVGTNTAAIAANAAAISSNASAIAAFPTNAVDWDLLMNVLEDLVHDLAQTYLPLEGGALEGPLSAPGFTVSGTTITNWSDIVAGYATTGEVAAAIAAATNHAVEAANVRFDLSGSPDGDKFAFWKYTGWSDGKGHYGLGYTNGVLVPSAPTPDLPTGIGTSNFVFVAIVSNYNTGSDTSYRWTNLDDISPDMTSYATTGELAEAVAPLADTNWVAEYVAEHAPSGGGTWEPTYRIVTATNDTVLATDWLIWMDSEAAEDTQILDLPDMTNASLTVIVRHLGSDHPTILRRATETATNTYQLTGDGASVAVDWLGARNTWYWRQAY